MQAIGPQPQRAPDGAPLHCERHRPEQTTLYRLVHRHAASFIAHTEASTGSELPRFVKDEFNPSSSAASWRTDSRGRAREAGQDFAGFKRSGLRRLRAEMLEAKKSARA